MTVSEWRKSTHSQPSANCVEMRRDRAALRDSKNPGGPVLSCANVVLLVTWVRSL